MDFSFSIYQWIALLFGLLMLVKAWSHFLRREKSIKELVAWHILFGSMIWIALRPDNVQTVALYTGFESGINAIVFLCLAVLFYLVFRLVNVVENIERNITRLIRELALREEEKK